MKKINHDRLIAIAIYNRYREFMRDGGWKKRELVAFLNHQIEHASGRTKAGMKLAKTLARALIEGWKP